jgi:hypothetical protein
VNISAIPARKLRAADSPRGGVFRGVGFQARNVLPAFAIHTCRTDAVMRSETLTIDVNHYPTIEPVHDIRFQRGWQRTGAPKSRWCPSVFSRSDFNCSALVWTASRLTELRDTPTVCAISGRTSLYSRLETPRQRAERMELAGLSVWKTT